MTFWWLLLAVLLIAQVLWAVTSFGLYWWMRPILPGRITARKWIIGAVLVADVCMAVPHLLGLFSQWRWLAALLLVAFYGCLATIGISMLQGVLRRRLSVSRLHRTIRWSLPLLIVSFVAWGVFSAYVPHVVRYQVQLDKPLDKPVRIALISDTHFGSLIGHRHIGLLKEIVDHEKPDMLMLAGDIVDDLPDVFQQKNMARHLRQIRTPLGQYAVLGNHDNYYGLQTTIVDDMESSGFTVLRDDVVTIDDRFVLVGRRDREEVRDTPAELIPSSDLPVIVLDHQPADMGKVAQTDADLMLVGHTHNGQVFPGTVFVKLFQKYTHGHYRVNGTQLVVTSGYGLWGIPFRMGTRSEVAMIDITGREQQD